MASTMNDELNSQLVGILELSEEPLVLYAAQRIEELEFLNYTGSQEFDNVNAQNDANLQASQSLQSAYNGILDKMQIQRKEFEAIRERKFIVDEKLSDLEEIRGLLQAELEDRDLSLTFVKKELKKYQNAYAIQVEENQRQSKIIKQHAEDQEALRARLKRQGIANDRLTTQLINARAENQSLSIGAGNEE